MLKIGAACLIVLGLVGIDRLAVSQTTSGLPKNVIRNIVLYEKAGEYCAWPSVVRTKAGDLLVSFIRSEEHLGPDGAVMAVRSKDNGRTWRSAEVIYDTVLDDRECGFTMLKDGRILGHFRSVQWSRQIYASYPGSYEDHVLERWSRYVDQPSYAGAGDLNGSWMTISSDGGKNWGEPMQGPDSIHGGIQLSNGIILVASYRDNGGNIGVYSTGQPEQAWKLISGVVCPKPDSLRFGEPHILQLPSGRVIMMIRATTKPYNDSDPRCFLWQTYSDDNGKTWAAAWPTELWGFPPHVTQLEDGRILCTYGYRRPPFGQRACLSDDGITWKKSNEIVLRDDAPNKDLGYPASIEIEPGVILTVYYQPNVPRGTVQRMNPPDPARRKPGILGTIWRVPGY